MPEHIQVELTLLPSEHGGRKSPVSSGYRPQFYYQGDDWDAAQTYPGVEQVRPGDTVTANLSFFCPEAHRGKLFASMPFLIREGNHVVGYGRITRILDPRMTVEAMQGMPAEPILEGDRGDSASMLARPPRPCPPRRS